METLNWALLIAYWLHMIFTVLWVGVLAALKIFLHPFIRGSSSENNHALLRLKLLQRSNPAVLFSLAVLAATGLLQMSAHPSYQGFLDINSRWSLAILVKHILFLIMAVISAYLAWGLTPDLERLLLIGTRMPTPTSDEDGGSSAQKLMRLANRIDFCQSLNLVLGICVLALTAVARVS